MTEVPALARDLNLTPHPEGGWYRETWRSDLTLPAAALPDHDGPRSAGTAIYFLLSPDEHSAWHRVRSAELWLWHCGGPLTLSLGGDGSEPGPAHEMVLGPDVAAGEHPQVVVPAGVWQAAHPAGGVEVLVSCVVVPGFEFADFTLTDG